MHRHPSRAIIILFVQERHPETSTLPDKMKLKEILNKTLQHLEIHEPLLISLYLEKDITGVTARPEAVNSRKATFFWYITDSPVHF